MPALDYSFLENIPPEIQAALDKAMQEEGDTLPWQESYTVTYLTILDGWVTGTLVPTVVVASGWEYWPDNARVIDLLVYRDTDAAWKAHFAGTEGFSMVAKQVPLEVGDYSLYSDTSGVLDASSAGVSYKLPWSYGSKWITTQSWHPKEPNAIDFRPTDNNWSVLAAADGQVSTACADGYQVLLAVTHADSKQTRYLHLDQASAKEAFGKNLPSGTKIVQGKYLGKLFWQEVNQPHPAWVCDLEDAKFNTICGCGNGYHLHFIVPNHDITVETLDNSGNTGQAKIGTIATYNAVWKSSNKQTDCADSGPDVNEVTVFSDNGYAGKCATFKVSGSAQKPSDFTIKSMRVGIDMQATPSGGSGVRGSMTNSNKWKEVDNLNAASVLVQVKQCDSADPVADQIFLYTSTNWTGACQRHDLADKDEREFSNSDAYKLSGTYRSLKLGPDVMAKVCEKDELESCDRAASNKGDVVGNSLKLLRRDNEPPSATTFAFTDFLNGIVYSNNGIITVRVKVEDKGDNAVGVDSVRLIRGDTNEAVAVPATGKLNSAIIYEVPFSVSSFANRLNDTIQIEITMRDAIGNVSTYRRIDAKVRFPDFNGNGKVDVPDVIEQMKNLFGGGELSLRYDVDGNGVFDLVDIIEEISIAFGPVPGQPATIAATAEQAVLPPAEPDRVPTLVLGPALALSSSAKGITIQGDRGYVAGAFNAQLDTLAVTAGQPPSLIATLPLYGTVATDVDVAGSRIFVVQPVRDLTRDAVITALSVLNLPPDGSAPTFEAEHRWGIYAWRIATDGTYVYAAGDDSHVFNIYNLTDSHSLVPVASYLMAGRNNDLVVDGNTAFVTDDSVGVVVFDITDRANPRVIGTLSAPGLQLHLAYRAPLLVVTDRNGRVSLADVSIPATPVLLSSLDRILVPKSSLIVGNQLYVAAGDDGVYAIDISNPAAPRIVGQVNTPDNATELAAHDARIFVADDESGIQTIQVNPCAGQFYTEYYSAATMGPESLVYGTCDSTLAHYWGDGSPGYGVPADNFWVRSQGSVALEQGSYVFSAQADDGIRVYVDSALVIDAWDPTPQPVLDGQIYLTTGDHNVQVQYREATGAAAFTLTWKAYLGPEVCPRADTDLAKTLAGLLNEDEQVQRYCLTLLADQWLSVRAFAAADLAVDPVIQVFDPTGQLIAASDDATAMGLNAATAAHALVSGVYQVAVENVNGADGSYQLRTEAAPQASPVDVDFNCQVETADFDLLKANVGGTNPTYDVNLDGSVTDADVQLAADALAVYGSGGIRCDGTILAVLSAVQSTAKAAVGSQATLAVDLLNAGTLATGFDIQVQGEWTATVTPAAIESLAPGSSTTLQVKVQVPAGSALGTAKAIVVTAIPRTNQALRRIATLNAVASGAMLAKSGSSALSQIGGWEATKLVDGNEGSVFSSRRHDEHLAGAEWAVVGLAQRATIDHVRIRPRANPADPGNTMGFPKDFVVQYSFNGADSTGRQLTCDPGKKQFKELTNWKPLLALYGYTQPKDGWIDFAFLANQADCVRILGAELSQDDYGARYLQLAEIEVYAGTAKLPALFAAASSQIGGWEASKLVDGNEGSVFSSTRHDEHLAGAEWAVVGLAQRATIDHVRIRPRANPADPGNTMGFPKDFVIQYSFNGTDASGQQLTCDPRNRKFKELTNWKPLLALYGYTQPKDGWIDFAFLANQADCVRILGAELSQDDYGARYLQLAEIEVYAGTAKLPTLFATASSQIGGWEATKLVDGNEGSVFSSTRHDEHLAGAEWAVVGLAQRATIDHVRIRPRANPADPGNTMGFPKDFVIQYSFNGTDASGQQLTCDPRNRKFKELTNWKPLLALYGYTQPKDGWIDFAFLANQADCVRILGAELSQDDYGARYLQLAEIEVYGK